MIPNERTPVLLARLELRAKALDGDIRRIVQAGGTPDAPLVLAARRAMDRANAAFPGLAVPSVQAALACLPVREADLLAAIASRVPGGGAPAGVRRSPRQVFRVVTTVAREVSEGGFAKLDADARSWFRVAPAAFRVWGRDDVAALLAKAWGAARSETSTGPRASLRRFDAEKGIVEAAVLEGLVPFVRAHAAEFLALDA